MSVNRSLRWYAVLVLTAGCLLVLANPPQKKSAKELAKEAQTDEENNQWQAAFEKLQAAAAEKPKNKNITEELQVVREHLSNKIANEAMASCTDLKIDKCEQEVRQALSYMSTPQAEKAESQLKTEKTQLQARWDQAEQMIGTGRLDDANRELKGLNQFAYLFPNLPAEQERLRTLRLEADLKQGGKAVDERQFDVALDAFHAALSLDPHNAVANHGIDTAREGEKAFALYRKAQEAFHARQYDAAYQYNQQAQGMFPQGKEFSEFDKQLRAQWLPLLEDAAVLNPKSDDWKGNQAAWANLQWIQRLDPGYKGLNDATGTIRLNLYQLYSSKADEYQNDQNHPRYSAIGIAYLYHANAQLMSLGPQGDPLSAKFSEVKDYFARKRAMKVLISVRNLSAVSPASAGFPEVVNERASVQVEGLGLPDLKLLPLQKYEDKPELDPLFQDLRPDGKSPIAELDVDIRTFQTESTGNEKAEDKLSKFVEGQETVPNPEYQKAFDHFSEVTKELARNKHKNKPTKLHKYTETDRILADKQLESTPKTITRDKIVEYHYQVYNLSNSAHIVMHLELRDYMEKQLLGSADVDVRKDDKATEVSGVHTGDVNGLINRPPRLKTTDQLVTEAELDALKELDQKVPQLLAKYTERYYKEGEKALGEQRPDDALENFICYWYTFHDRMDEKHDQRVREVVRQYTGLDLGGPGL